MSVKNLFIIVLSPLLFIAINALTAGFAASLFYLVTTQNRTPEGGWKVAFLLISMISFFSCSGALLMNVLFVFFSRMPLNRKITFGCMVALLSAILFLFLKIFFRNFDGYFLWFGFTALSLICWVIGSRLKSENNIHSETQKEIEN